MILWKCIFFMIFVCCTVSSSNVDLIKFIKDFLVIQKNPIVSLYLCWNSNEKIQLAKYLHDDFIRFYYANMSEPFIYKQFIEQLFLLDLRCPESLNLLDVANKEMLFQQPYRWLILIDNCSTIPHYLDILVDSQFYLIKKLPIEIYTLYSTYKISKDSKDFIINDVAAWSPEIGFKYFNQISAVKNRTDLMGMTMNVSYVLTDDDSLNHLWDYRNKHIDGISKLNYILTHHVTDFMNASRNFIVRNTWGYKNETTNMYDGLVGDLQSGRAEFAGTASFFTKDRISVVDFIAATTPTRAKFIFRAPPLSYVTNVFTLPFDRMVWYANFLSIGVISIVVYIIVKWEWSRSEFRDKLAKKQNAMRPKYIDVLLMELGAVCQQGSEAEPKSGAGQIATMCIFSTLMFMYTSYSANIVALLQSTSESIKTLDDLLNSRIKLGVEDKPYSHYYFKMQTEKTRRAIYTQKVAPPGQKPSFMNVEEGIKKVREEFFAFHVECATGYKIVADIFQENEKCGLREIEYWQIIDPWVAVKKNSSYKELAKVAYRKLQEHGLQNREFTKLYAKKPVCQSRGSNFMSVGLIDCYFPFLIFAIGCLIAVGVLLLELVYKRRISYIMLIKHKSETDIGLN